MFDLGLISAGEEYEILIAQDGIAEETSHRLITEDKQLLLHQRRELLLHQGYLRWLPAQCVQRMLEANAAHSKERRFQSPLGT
jgi:hypothetical protein